MDLREVRSATLAAVLDEEPCQAELLALPALSDIARKKVIAAGYVDARAATVSELTKITDVSPARRSDAAARKMACARGMVVSTAMVNVSDDRDEKLRMLRDVDDQ